MKKTMTFLSMATLVALGTIFVGCTKFEDKQPKENKTLKLTTTIGFSDDEDTKALTAAGVKTFDVDDQIAIYYIDVAGKTRCDVSDKIKAEDIHDGGLKADIKVTFNYIPENSGAVRYVYPANMAKSIDEGDEINDDKTIDFDKLETQDGTLATLGKNFDLCIYDGNFSGTGELPISAQLTNKLAILAITLKDNVTPTANVITNTLTEVTISDGAHTYNVAPTSGTFGVENLYVAIQPVSVALAYTASNGTDYFNKTASSREYVANSFYNLGLRMTTAGKKLSKAAVNNIIGSDGHAYPGSDYDKLPAGVTSVARVLYVKNGHGLALALAEEGNMAWQNAIDACDAKNTSDPIPGCTWKLATKDEWKSMISGAGGCTALRDGFDSIGGTNLDSNTNTSKYWASTKPNKYGADYYNFGNANWVMGGFPLSNHVRPCLSF